MFPLPISAQIKIIVYNSIPKFFWKPSLSFRMNIKCNSIGHAAAGDNGGNLVEILLLLMKFEKIKLMSFA